MYLSGFIVTYQKMNQHSVSQPTSQITLQREITGSKFKFIFIQASRHTQICVCVYIYEYILYRYISIYSHTHPFLHAFYIKEIRHISFMVCFYVSGCDC